MSNICQWRSYVDGQALPAYQATTHLDDFAAFDHTTNASGLNPGVTGDWSTSFGPAITGVIDCLLTPSAPVLLDTITFSAHFVISGAPTVSQRYELYATVGGIPSLFKSGTLALGFNDITATVFPAITASEFRLLVFFDRPGPGSPQMAMSVTDFRQLGTVCTPPGAPGGFALTNQAEPGGTVAFTLSWLDSPTGDLPITYYAYRVNAGTADTLLGTKVSGVDTPPYTFVDTGRTLGQDYCYHVLPVNGCGVGTGTGQVCSRLDPVVNPPNNFHGLEECEGNQVSLFWDLPVSPPVFDGFRIRRDGILFATLGSTIQTWVDDSPGIGFQHIYSIVAYNIAGESQPASLTIIPCEWSGCVEDAEPGVWSIIV